MNTNNYKSKGVLIGLVALAVGVAIGVAATEVSQTNQRQNKTQPSLASIEAPAMSAGSNQWDPFQEIQRMQSQMDQSFNQMFEQFRMQPQFDFLQANPNYSTSINVENLKDRYVVRAFLPDAKASDVHVTLNNGQTLTVEVNNRQTENSNQTNAVSQVSQWGQYEQTVQLPTPVKQNQMTVRHDGHDLIITIPKAS